MARAAHGQDTREAPRSTARLVVGRVSLPEYQVRTCPNCGQRAWFRLDPDGVWYACQACGHYA